MSLICDMGMERVKYKMCPCYLFISCCSSGQLWIRVFNISLIHFISFTLTIFKAFLEILFSLVHVFLFAKCVTNVGHGEAAGYFLGFSGFSNDVFFFALCRGISVSTLTPGSATHSGLWQWAYSSCGSCPTRWISKWFNDSPLHARSERPKC
jgi:hypothetical protein